MHVDGLQEVAAISGYKIDLSKDLSLNDRTIIINHKHRDLAPKPAPIVNA